MYRDSFQLFSPLCYIRATLCGACEPGRWLIHVIFLLLLRKKNGRGKEAYSMAPQAGVPTQPKSAARQTQGQRFQNVDCWQSPQTMKWCPWSPTHLHLLPALGLRCSFLKTTSGKNSEPCTIIQYVSAENLSNEEWDKTCVTPMFLKGRQNPFSPFWAIPTHNVWRVHLFPTWQVTSLVLIDNR